MGITSIAHCRESRRGQHDARRTGYHRGCQDFARNVVRRPSLGPIEAEHGFPEFPFFIVLASGKIGHVVPRERHGYDTFFVETDTVGFIKIEI